MSNKLPADQAERLELLIEECSEIIHAATKALRHGLDSRHPSRPSLKNREQIAREIGQLQWVTDLMLKHQDIQSHEIVTGKTLKEEFVRQYLHHQS